ncbi:Aspartyl-tRNA(Asn) amidotransferase subunit A, Glutamyl-tRNA(Gln) amidotransferase subunit A [Salinisphaera sp. LB1]|nr:Aspartyl-tRNA(Asn) amidotransferase subunit A, Glutamyl-tRNA(Gln) amidotransferase subunit A [Salinisphaera sp. LB1]
MTADFARTLASDPFDGCSLDEFGRRLRTGESSAEDVTRACLSRIEVLDPKLGAFEYVAAGAALAQAQAIDALLASGADLGPLMGVPVAVKDLFAIDGMPVTAGSRVPLDDAIGAEGPFVKALKRAGCVILGTTRTVECAFGAAGINSVRGTPWNPWDAGIHRLPGGSSSGSAVAVSAGLCAFAIGTDTGGSVRVPAALCGIFGLKTTVGLWPTQGVFPLSTTLDSIGLLTRDADDAATALAALTPDTHVIWPAPPPATLRLGRIRGYMDEQIDPNVHAAFETAVERLQSAGVTIEDVPLPEAEERERLIPAILGSEVLATVGRERFKTHRGDMDPVVAARIAAALDMRADEYIQAIRRHQALRDIMQARLQRVDGWISPTCAVPPLPVADFADPEDGTRLAGAVTRCSQPGNIFGLCGANVPLTEGQGLPVGFQLLCAPNTEAKAAAIGKTFQRILGRRQIPPVETFLADSSP